MIKQFLTISINTLLRLGLITSQSHLAHNQEKALHNDALIFSFSDELMSPSSLMLTEM